MQRAKPILVCCKATPRHGPFWARTEHTALNEFLPRCTKPNWLTATPLATPAKPPGSRTGHEAKRIPWAMKIRSALNQLVRAKPSYIRGSVQQTACSTSRVNSGDGCVLLDCASRLVGSGVHPGPLCTSNCVYCGETYRPQENRNGIRSVVVSSNSTGWMTPPLAGCPPPGWHENVMDGWGARPSR